MPATNMDVRGFTPRDILTGQVVELIAKRGTSVSLSERRHVRFPSVLLQPLGHLSVFRINNLRAVCNRLSHTSALLPTFDAIVFGFSELKRTDNALRRNCVRPLNVVRSLTAIQRPMSVCAGILTPYVEAHVDVKLAR